MGTTSTKAQKVGGWFLASPIRIMVVPYAVGIVWHGLHPVSSILTFDMKRPRRVYIDENSLETSHFNVNGASYDLIQQTKYDRKKYKILAETDSASQSTIESLCHGVRTLHSNYPDSFVTCHRYHSIHHGISFEVAKIQPSSAGVLPGNEAIVLVVPPFESFSPDRFRTTMEVPLNFNKSRWQLQASLLQLIRRLSSQSTSPWLAMSILVVSPVNTSKASENMSSTSQTKMNPMLERTVESFLDVFLGRFHLNRFERSLIDERMPIDYTGAILRNLIVLDLEVFAADNAVSHLNSTKVAPELGELRILLQGRRGILPNMDLAAAALAVYDRSTMLGAQQVDPAVKQKYKLVQITVHPHQKKVESWFTWLKGKGLPLQVHDWTYKMLHLLAFEYAMALGPYPPHAPALERGIDSLTIQGVFPYATDEDDFDFDNGNTPRSKLSPQQYPLELVQKIEYFIRALTNLHERLHHSTSLYLLSSQDRFIKHEEYLIPTLLLITPLIIRALFIVFRQEKCRGHPFRFDYKAARLAIIVCTLWTATFSVLATDKVSALIGTQRKQLVEFSLEWTGRFRSFICSSFIPDPKDGYRATVFAALGSWKGWLKWPDSPFSTMKGSIDDNQLLFLYTLSLLALVLSHQQLTTLRLGEFNSRESIQCMTCLLAAFIHIALAFGHASMAFASALFWTPLLAFHSQNCRAGRSKIFSRFAVKMSLFVVSCPFSFFLPLIFPAHLSVFCRYAYLPLHFLFSLLLLTE